MKKHYTKTIVAFTMLFALNAQAQDFVYTPSQTIVQDIYDGGFVDFQIDLTTPTPEAITFEWERVEDNLPETWSYSLCDYTGCYPSVPATGTMTPITLAEAQNGVQAFFKLSIYSGQNFGQGEVKIYVYEQGNYSRGDTVTFDLTRVQSTGIIEDDIVSISLSPNPVNDQLNAIVGKQRLTVNVMNMTGQLMTTESFAANSTGIIDFSEYKPGIYFVRCESASGPVITKKIVKR